MIASNKDVWKSFGENPKISEKLYISQPVVIHNCQQGIKDDKLELGRYSSIYKGRLSQAEDFFSTMIRSQEC